MKTSSSLLVSSEMAIRLTATAIAIAFILLASNFTTINAQQQFNQPGEIENETTEAIGTTTPFQSTNDSFSIQVPDGWIIQDVNNTGPALLEERTQGYAILAQLCPEEQQRAIPSNASISTTSCQGAQDVIHIIRYPDLDTRLLANNVTTNNTTTTIDNILTYHLQKLQEVGYRSMQIVNSTDMTSNLRNPETNEIMTTEPAKFVEMRYSTNATPDETRRGYFILTATSTTAPNLGATKGYSIFYEGNATTSATTAAEITTAAASLSPPPAVGQVLNSFELIAAAEATEDVDDDDDDDNGGDDDDNGGNGDDDGDDNGGDDNGGDDNGGDDNGGDDDDNGGNGDDDGDDNGGDDNGGDDDNGDNNGEDGDEGEGNQEGNNPNEFGDCIVPPGRDPGDVGC